VPEPSVLEVELAIEKLKSHKSPGIDQIPAELIKAGDRTIRAEMKRASGAQNRKRKVAREKEYEPQAKLL
jgi:hypothetical protein